MLAELSKRRELIRCALNKSRRLLYGGSHNRRAVLVELVRSGHLEAVKPESIHNIETPWLTIDDGAALRLSDQGRDAILKLNPADFASVLFYPSPSDVEKAQGRVSQQEKR